MKQTTLTNVSHLDLNDEIVPLFSSLALLVYQSTTHKLTTFPIPPPSPPHPVHNHLHRPLSDLTTAPPRHQISLSQPLHNQLQSSPSLHLRRQISLPYPIHDKRTLAKFHPHAPSTTFAPLVVIVYSLVGTTVVGIEEIEVEINFALPSLGVMGSILRV
ncbi:hypothetical protein glysoja_043599 [Glycine soja]|uniref:Uncharacterized protein n=1 Tax=Glycine soja TaxID=3848 RepID=A0A0B2QWZ8_GLYSO|nr:hypothetical protein glysoja_043599 [Glycine soja]